MASQTRITIRHDSLLVLEIRSARRSWCASCAADAEIVSLDLTTTGSEIEKAVLQRCLDSPGLHRFCAPDGSLLICLESLRQMHAEQSQAATVSRGKHQGGTMKSKIGVPALGTGIAKLVNLTRRLFTLALCMTLLAACATAAPVVYVVTSNQQFGTVDLATGVFHQIGTNTPEGQANLVWGPEGSLLSLTYSGNLEKINPVTGQTTVIGQTGLGYNAFDLAAVAGRLFATDFSNNLYSVDPATGAATLVGNTVMPSDPQPPFSTNGDGTINLCAESLYGAGGAIYATFYAFTLDPTSLAENPTVAPALYRIDARTGAAIFIANTAPDLGASVLADGNFYAFRWAVTGFGEFGPQIQSLVVTLDVASGSTNFVSRVDPAAGGILGAAPAGSLRWRLPQ